MMYRLPDGQTAVRVTSRVLARAQEIADTYQPKGMLIIGGTVRYQFDSGDGQSGSVEDRRCDLCRKVQAEMLCGVGPVTFEHMITGAKADVVLGLCDRCLAAEGGAN